MKDSNHCPKCNSTNIIRVGKRSKWDHHNNMIQAGFQSIEVVRYVCVNCTFTEEYVENKKDLEKLVKKYGNNSNYNEFV